MAASFFAGLSSLLAKPPVGLGLPIDRPSTVVAIDVTCHVT